MGNEVSRPVGSGGLSPQNSGVVPPRSPYTPTGTSSRRAQSFNARSMSPSMATTSAPTPQRRTSSSSSLGSNPSSNPKKERTIQRMDKAIRRRVRGGITYNMKLLIRGAKGTGKTSLFHRLKGEPIPETHQSTPQLQSATINWSFRQNLEENVKCEVWDVVDRGFVPVEAENGGEEGSNGRRQGAAGGSAEHGGLQSGGGLSAEATAAAAAASTAMQNGTHSVAIVDASTVDVYQEAHGVIFLLDVTKWDTLEYVKQQLDNVPMHIPTLVLGNFRDQGAQRKIFKEDIQELLYGSSDRPQHQQWRRPVELLYFECSLLNCYGLKSLHQYFGIPFLQLKLQTIRQQMRIVEGEFAYLKHDVQASISEQRYAEYVELIKATGSDIRTGRRGSGNGNTPPAMSKSNSVRLSPKENSQTKPRRQENGVDDDVSVVSKENDTGIPSKPADSGAFTATVATEASQQRQKVNQSQDIEDLPARNSSVVIQAASSLKFEHKDSATSISADVAEDDSLKLESKPALVAGASSEISVVSSGSPSRRKKTSVEEVMHLEDFQVPKSRTSDLDHFYSEDESDEDVGGYDEDVVVAPVDGLMKASISGVYHKQRFIDSDSSESDGSESADAQRGRKKSAPGKRSPRRAAAKPASTTGGTVSRPIQSSPSPHPPTSASRPKQRSRPGSPARTQSSSSVKELQTEASPKLRQSAIPTSVETGTVTSTPPAAPPASPLVSPICHTSPRNKSDNSVVGVHSETLCVSLSQDEDGFKQEPLSDEEPELTGTEVAVEPLASRGHKSSKSPTDATYASREDVDGDADNIDTATPQTTNKKSDASVTSMEGAGPQPDTSNATEDEINSEPEDVARLPITDQDANPSEMEAAASVDAQTDGVDAAASSNELNSYVAGDGSEEKDGGNASVAPQEDAVEAEKAVLSRSLKCSQRDALTSDGESDTSDHKGSTELSLSSLQAYLPMPEASAPSLPPIASASIDNTSPAAQGQEEVMGHYHKRNIDESGDLFSLSALQASLPLPAGAVAPLASTVADTVDVSADYSYAANDSRINAALHLSDLQTIPSKIATSKQIVPDVASFVSSNDLEAFLNESDSDSENAQPPTYAEPPRGSKQWSEQEQHSRRAMLESSDDDDDEADQDRFASYSISKKSRSERRRQQKEDLRQLNAAFDKDNDPFALSTSGVSISDSSFGTLDVMEAIRKAQEDAMRMLPTEPTPADDDADSSSTKKKHKHKKGHKHKKREGEEGSKEKSLKKSTRKSGSSSSKKRHPRVEDDLM